MKLTVGMQNDKSHYAIAGPRYRRFLKRVTVKAMRRLGRLLRDDAPKKARYDGCQS
jgi:hypothetical protein